MAEAMREAVIEQVLDDRGGEALLSRLSALADLGQEFAQSIDIDETLAGAVERIAGYLDAEAASVFLVDDAGGGLTCRASAGPVDVTGLSLELGQGIVGRTAAKNQCQLVRDARRDPDFARRVDRDTGFETRSVLCAPLRSAHGVIGVLQVLNRRGGGLFDERDRSLLRVLAAPTALAINNARMASELLAQQQLRRELQLARRLQRSLLPRRRPEPFPVLAVNLPARQVSGDFYDFFELPDGRIAFTVGDVSGKGMNAALLMSRATSLLRWIGKSGLPPGRWLAEVNDELCSTVSHGMFVCALAGYYDPLRSEARWANAGFPPPLVRRPGGFDRYPAGAPPLAIVPGLEIAEATASLADTFMFLYSDGASDVRDGEELLGEEGLTALLARYGERAPPSRMGAVLAALRRLRVTDDTTLMTIQGAGAGGAAK